MVGRKPWQTEYRRYILANTISNIFHFSAIISSMRLQEAGIVPGSPFHTCIFKACGKLPAAPCLEQLRPLLASPAFSGCADDYLDPLRSTLLMYCVGPANDESLPMASSSTQICMGVHSFKYAHQ